MMVVTMPVMVIVGCDASGNVHVNGNNVDHNHNEDDENHYKLCSITGKTTKKEFHDDATQQNSSR